MKVDESMSLKVGEGVRMLVDGLWACEGVKLKVDESMSLKVGEGVRL